VILYRQELLRFCRPDIERMAREQWQETGDAWLKCDPLWEMYDGLERANGLVLVIAREYLPGEKGRAIGYLAGAVYPHPNARHSRVGSLSTYYCERRPGRALVIKSLLKHGTALAFEKGACKVIVRTVYDLSAGRIIEALGGKPDAIEYKITRPTIAKQQPKEMAHGFRDQ
jgi:hypothetical protein